MKRILAGSAALCLVLTAPVWAEPIPVPGIPGQIANAEASNRSNTLLTPEQREQLSRQAELIANNRNDSIDRGEAARARRNGTDQQILDVAIDPGTDRTRAEVGADTADALISLTRTTRENITDSQRRIIETSNALETYYQTRADMIASNPNATPAQIREARESVQIVANVRQTAERQIEAINLQLDRTEQYTRENRQQIIDGIANGDTRLIHQAGDMLTQAFRMPLSDPSASLRTTVGTRQAPSRPAPTSSANQPPSGAIPATPATPSTASAARRPVQRGTIPGQNGDPYAGLRVQDGSTPATPQPQTAAQARAQQQAQAERNQARTDQARQQAMDRARIDNAEIDALSGAAHAAGSITGDLLRDTEAAVQEYNGMLDALRRSARPGNVGGTGSSGGEGLGGGGGPYDDQMAGGDGLPGGIPSIVEWEGRDPVDGDFGSADAFGAATEYGLDASDLAALAAEIDAWESFELGGTITVADLLPIYAGYDLDNAPLGSSGRSPSSAGSLTPSSAGNSLSSAGNSLSSAGSMTPSSAPTGMRVDWGSFNLSADPFRVSNGSRPEPGSYADMLRQINSPGDSLLNTNPWTDSPLANNYRDLANALYGPLWSDRRYRIQADPNGNYGRAISNVELASLYDTDFDTLLRSLGSDFDGLRELTANGRGGLDRLLAQPFNVLLTWGAGANDLDLHATGPLGAGTTDRFHIYFSAQGNLTAQPFAQLIKDCICISGSEVILTSALNRGAGVYRISVFNYGDQAANSTNLANASTATVQIVRGGTAVSVGDGTTIVGGHTLLTVRPPSGQPGNTWVAAEINPNNGRITAPTAIVQSGSSDSVH